MARVGRFGRNRKAGGSSNLTQVIANLMREQRQAEDRAAFDAWQNGGEFKGKAMTDDRIVEYIKGRRNMMSTDDPLWDEWNNTLIQTRFSIGEQKIGLAFKQGRASAGAVAAWYRGQLANIPRKSAFYRDVAGRAADWAKSAAGAARAGASAAAGASARNRVDRLQGLIAKSDAITAAIEAAAKNRGIIDRDGSIWDADASRLEEMFAQGVQLNGRSFTMDDWRKAAVVAYNSTGQMRKAYKALGWDTSSLQSGRKNALDKLLVINAVDDRSAYETNRDLWVERLADAQNDPYAIDAINKDYAATLGKILAGAESATGGQANEDAFIGGLRNEISALVDGVVTGPTVAEQFDIERDDSATTAASIAQNVANLDALASGQAIFGQAEPGGKYVVQADPLGMVAKDPSMQRTIANIGGNLRDVYLKGSEVKSAVLVAPDGTIVPVDDIGDSIQSYLNKGYDVKEDGNVVGYVFSDGQGKVNYGIYDESGVLRYTPDNPFSEFGAGTSEGSFLAIGDGQFTENGGTVIDHGSLFGAALNPALLGPLPLGQGVSTSSAAAYLSATGEDSDADLAAQLRALPGAPQGLAPGQLSDGQQERLGMQSTSPVMYGPMPLSATSTGSVVQNALSSTLGNIQTGLAPLFGPTAPSSPATPYNGLTPPPQPQPITKNVNRMPKPEVPKAPEPPKNPYGPRERQPDEYVYPQPKVTVTSPGPNERYAV
jgi:hypothetical protein